jgi:putative transposase
MVPMELEPGATDGIIALDPGDRTFLTGFDGQNIIEIGKHDKTRLFHLCQRLDRIQSQIDKLVGKANKRKRFNLRKLAQNLRIKIRSLVDEAHHKVAAFLTKTYKVVLIPQFETSGMTKRDKRKITSKTARSMLTWAHYRFRQTLIHHATKRNCVVIVDDEAYTSKTCSCCGAINLKLGGAKVFQCKTCNHVIGRDWNGAINIFFKTIAKVSRLFAGFREDTPEHTVESIIY